MKATSPGTWRLRWPCRSALSDARDGRVNGAIRSADAVHQQIAFCESKANQWEIMPNCLDVTDHHAWNRQVLKLWSIRDGL